MFDLARKAACAVLVALAVAMTASAAHAQSRAEASCRASIAKHLGKFVSKVFKDLNACHYKRSTGRLPLSTNCNDVFSIPGNKSVAAYEKASLAMLDSCPNSLTAVLAQYARCPSPHSHLDDDDATSGIDNFDEATDCVLSLAATLANGASATVLGYPRTLPTRAAAKCQRAVGKAFRKRIDTIGKVRRKCQSGADRNAAGLAYSCANFVDDKIADNVTAMAGAIAQACDVPQDDLVVLGACGQTAAQFNECAEHIATSLGGGLVAEAYELPSTCKLGHAAVLINAGHGAMQTSTQFEVGYNGLGLGVDLLDGFEGAVDLSCNDDCIDCIVTIDPIKEKPNSNCRCDNNPTIHCDTVHGADADDCGGGHCTCMFAPPLPLSAGSVPACVVNKLVAELDGVADGGTGVSTTTVYNTSVVHLGISVVQPCPVCLGDTAPNDGLRDGTCSGGIRNSQACDENAVSPDFGAVSYECPPSPGSNVSGSGLELQFDVTSVVAPPIHADLTDNDVPVFCLQCSGNTQVGCASDADCAELGFGTCSVNTAPQARANACNDGICTAGTGEHAHGVCEANALDLFCDGVLRRDGTGLISCLSDGDCTVFDPVCPGGTCGACLHGQHRACFADPVSAVGSDGAIGSTPSSGVYGADLVSTLCVPATASNNVNQSVGLPGPARMLLNFDFHLHCESDHDVTFDLPGGSNCP